MSLDPATLFVSIVAGIIGIGYCSYGKKQQNVYFFVTGVGLMIYPYFIENVMALAGVGILLIVVPFVIKPSE